MGGLQEPPPPHAAEPIFDVMLIRVIKLRKIIVKFLKWGLNQNMLVGITVTIDT